MCAAGRFFVGLTALSLATGVDAVRLGNEPGASATGRGRFSVKLRAARHLTKEVRDVEQISLSTGLFAPEVHRLSHPLQANDDIGNGVLLISRNHGLLVT